MKKLFFITYFSVLALLAFTKTSSAALTPTVTPTPTASATNSILNKLEKKVTQLKLVEKRGIIGTVTDSSNTKITLSVGDNSQEVDVDELTQFASPSGKTNFSISDIKPNMHLGIIGQYNKDSKRILARIVHVIVPQITVHATLWQVAADKKSFTVISTENKKTTITIASVSKVERYNKTNGLAKTNVTKLTAGQHVIISGYADTTKLDTVIATNVIVFPDLPKNPRIDVSAFSLNK